MVKMMQEVEVMKVVEIIYLGSTIQRRRGWVEVIVRWSEVFGKKRQLDLFRVQQWLFISALEMITLGDQANWFGDKG